MATNTEILQDIFAHSCPFPSQILPKWAWALMGKDRVAPPIIYCPKLDTLLVFRKRPVGMMQYALI